MPTGKVYSPVTTYSVYCTFVPQVYVIQWQRPCAPSVSQKSTLSVLTARDEATFGRRVNQGKPHVLAVNDAANFDLKLCEDSRTLYSETSCGSCLFETCYVCHSYDKQYNNICRFCPPDDDLCAENLGCNEGYYLDFGVCFKCPIGCATCISETECTDCDAGNYLRTLDNNDIICDCEDGWFGTIIGSMLSCI